MSDTVLTVKNFRKAYGEFVAVNGISFQAWRGEIFGLLGPNGAGKTSTLECLEGLRRPDGGTIGILGVDPGREPQKLKNLIGVQLQASALPDNMTVEESMRFFCAYHHVSPRLDLIERMGLSAKRSTQFHKLSTGQQRRLALALAIAHNPPALFLDEPTAGLDVESRSELHSLMMELRAAGTTIILATHDMAEAEKVTNRVAILLSGQIVAEGSPQELTATGAGLTKVSVRSEQSILQQNGISFPAVQQCSQHDDYAIFFSANPGPTVSGILNYLDAHNDKLIDLRVERPTLEERFLEITGNGDRS